MASVCPRCSYLFTQRWFLQRQQGTLTQCRRCGGKIASEGITCPYCGLHPRKRRTLRVWLALSGITVLGIVGVGVRAVIMDRSGPVATESVDAPTATVPPLSASRTVATPIELPPPTVALMETRWTSTWVNVREGPAIDAPILQILSPGQRVEVADRQGGWCLTYRDGQRIGYIANSVLLAMPPDP